MMTVRLHATLFLSQNMFEELFLLLLQMSFCGVLSHYMNVKQVMYSPENVGAPGALNITAQLWNHWHTSTRAACVDVAKHFPKMSSHPLGLKFQLYK